MFQEPKQVFVRQGIAGQEVQAKDYYSMNNMGLGPISWWLLYKFLYVQLKLK